MGVTGVLTLYHLGIDAFTKDHLRVLLALKPKVSLTVENAMEFQKVAISATTDGLTSLPNARSLFLHLDAELGALPENRLRVWRFWSVTSMVSSR